MQGFYALLNRIETEHDRGYMFTSSYFKTVVLFLFLTSTLFSTTYYVDNNTSDGTWSGAYTDLQAALSAASSGDEIWVAAGTYYPTTTADETISFDIPTGVLVYGGFVGGEGSLDARDYSANPSILSGDIGTRGEATDNSDHVVLFSNVASQTVLDGFTIREGHGSNGGGIYASNSSPQLANLIITNNYVSANGGGIYFSAENSGTTNPVLNHCTISNNEAQNGAGLYLHGDGSSAMFIGGTHINPTMDRCIISGNAASSKGGGLYLDPQYNGDCKPLIKNSLLSGNKANISGGAIYNYAFDNAVAEPSMRNCTIVGNASPVGSAISSWLGDGGEAGFLVVNTIIWGNETSLDGQVANSYSTEPANDLPMYLYCLLEGSSSSSWDSRYGPTTGSSCIDGDPAFVDYVAHSNAPTTTGNYQLELVSPAMSAGYNSYVLGDYDVAGNDRISNGLVEMGAYEHLVGKIYVDCDATGANDGSSWADAITSLAFVPGVEVWVAEGTYKPTEGISRTLSFNIPNYAKVYGGFNGTETSLDQRDPLNNTTILSGNIGSAGISTDNSYHVVVLENSSDETILDGFTISGGYASGSTEPDNYGGGILVDGSGDLSTDDSRPLLRNLTITGNYASVSGGGIECRGDNYGSATPTFESCVITDNVASRGGGMHLHAINNGTASASMDRCVISGNTASNKGGGLYLNPQNNGDCKPSIKNSLLSGNTANNSGGAIYNYAFDGGEAEPNLRNCTIVGNASPYGGAISSWLSNGGQNGSSAYNTIIWGNETTNGGQIRTSYSSESANDLPTYYYCLLEGSSSSSWDESYGPTTGTACIDGNPEFIDYVAHSTAPTTTGNYQLGLISPAMSAGYNSYANGDYDIEGNDRIANNLVEIGAYEHEYGRLYVDCDATGANDGSSWADAMTSLNAALVLGGEAWVSQGIYKPTEGSSRTVSFDIPNDTKVYGGFDGTETSLDQRDPTTNITILSGNIGSTSTSSDNSYHVVVMENSSLETILDGFTITGGYADGSSEPYGYGGGVLIDGSGDQYTDNSRPKLRNLTISDNFASSAGGGIACLGNDHGEASPTLENCTITNNEADVGGGLFLFAYDYGSTNPSIDRCIVSGNSAINGGAIYLNPSFYGDCKPTINNTLISGNHASSAGGGIYNLTNDRGEAEATLRNCTIVGNAAAHGGAINTYMNSSETSYLGEAAYRVYNSIIWGNESTDKQIRTIYSGSPSNSTLPYFYYCDIEGSNSASWDSNISPNVGSDCINENPDFVSAVAYSSAPTTTGNYRLESNSPCIGVGGSTTSAYDLDGMDRVANLIVDMGAFEQPVNDLFVDTDAIGNNDGLSWTNAFTDLQSALSTAAGGVHVWVAEGTYYPTATADRTLSFNIPSNVLVYGGFDGTETEESQRNPENNVTILNGDIGVSDDNSDNSNHVVVFDEVGSYTTLDGFTVTLGHADWGGPLASSGSGGGIYIVNEGASTCKPNIFSCRIINNQAVDRGGAIYMQAVGGPSSNFVPVIEKCVISGNQAGYIGGGIMMDGSYGRIDPEVTNCLISGNKTNSHGGGIGAMSYFSGYIFATISGTTIAGNSAGESGGGLASLAASSGNSRFDLKNSIIWGNSRKGLQIKQSYVTINFYNVNIEDCGGYYNWNTNLGARPSSSYSTLDARPLFVALPDTLSAPTVSGDFHLSDSSPCIGVGSGGIEDITGVVRPANSDFGAYENPGSEKLHHLRVNSTVSGSIHNGISWATAFSNPEDALRAAVAGDTIWVAGGTYYPDEGYGYSNNDRSATFNFRAEAMLYGGFDGTENSIDERDGAANVTIFSGDIDGSPEDNSGNAYHVVSFSKTSGGTGAGLSDVTISGGNANLVTQGNGGGIYILYGSRAKINNCTVINNNALTGGGIWNSANSFELTQTRVAGNSASETGGGLYLNNHYPHTISNCIITGNYAGGGGDGVHLNSPNTSYPDENVYPTFINCTIAANGDWAISGNGYYLKNSIVWGGVVYTSSVKVNSFVWSTNWRTHPAFYDLPDASEAPTLSGNFRLSDVSPCIGAGSATDAPVVDFYGNARSGNPDQGAIENPLHSKQQRVYVGAETSPTSNPGASWSTAYAHLQDAIRCSVSGDSIWVAQGTYYPDEGLNMTDNNPGSNFSIPSGVNLFGGFEGTESALEQRNWFDRETILSGDIGDIGVRTDNSGTIVSFTDIYGNSELDGFTIRDSYSDSDVSIRGGGIYISNSSYSSYSCDPVIRNCWITNNVSNFGSGLSITQTASPTIEHCVISGNSGNDDSMGGAIYIKGDTKACMPRFDYCTIVGNTTTAGGAIYADASVADKTHITVLNSIIWNNSRTGSEIKLLNEANMTISNSIVTNSPSSDWNDNFGTDGGNNRSTDPQLVSIPDTLIAPTATGDCTPLFNSTCIEAGDASYTYDEVTNHHCGWKTDIGGIEYTGNRMSLPINGPGEYLFGGNVRMKVNVTVDNLDSLDIIVHPGEHHPQDATTVDRWYYVRPVGTGTFDLTFSYLNGELNGGGETGLSVYRYQDEAWSEALSGTGSNTADNWVTISNQTEGGEFAMGGGQLDTSLPVTLSEFKAEVHDQEVEIIWSTDSEIENLGFILERRALGFPPSSSRAESRDEDQEQISRPFDSAQGDATIWTQIATYQTHSELEGAGSSSTRSLYAYTDDNIEPGVIYEYRLADVSYSGDIVYHTMTLTDVMIEMLPEDYVLLQNYPNPFNPETSIRYSLPEMAAVNISIYDIQGREVVSWTFAGHQAGWHELTWNGTNQFGVEVAAGMYFTKLRAGSYTQTIRMLCLK